MGTIKTNFVFIFFIILSLSTIAENYTEAGNKNQYRLESTGYWNSETSDSCSSGLIDCNTRVLTNTGSYVLVSDLDNNGVNEIIVPDGTSIKLYQNTTLDILDSVSLSGTIREMITYDINGDGKQEVITCNDGGKVQISEYNGTYFNNTNNISFSNYISNAECHIACEDTNKCVVVYPDVSIGAIYTHIYANSFNSSDIIGTLLLATSTQFDTYNTNVCLSDFPGMEVADLNNDGKKEYTFSFYDYSVNTIYVKAFNLNSTGNPVLYGTYSTNTAIDVPVESCMNSQYFFNSPIAFNFDGFVSNGLEVIVGVMISDNDFRFIALKSDLTYLTRFPYVTNGEGVIISNPVRMNAFYDTGNVDVCVMGYKYDTSSPYLNLVCGSLQTGFTLQTEEFDYDLTGYYNVSGIYPSMIHATQQDNTLTEGSNLDEIATSYGIFKLDYTLTNELFLVWENPKPNAFLLPIDYEDIGRNDIIAITSANVWYIDDLFYNQNAYLQRITTNPSILSTIKVNETIHLTIQVRDEEGDNVQAGICAYCGEINEQNVTSGFSPNGATFPITFEANKTTANSILKIKVRDSEHNETRDTDLTFSIGVNGIVYGEAIYDSGDLTNDTEETYDYTGEYGTNYTAENNTLRDAIISISNTSGVTPVIFLILLIFAIDGVLIFITAKEGLVGVGALLCVVVDGFIVTLMRYLDLVSESIIVVFMFLLIIVGMLMLYSKYKNGGA